jgi:transposase, IS30 family
MMVRVEVEERPLVSMAVGLLPLRIELFRSNEFYPARVLLSLHNMHLCRHSLNFAHVPVVDAGHLPIVPGNRDRIPTRFGDNAAISGIAPPINAGALLEILGFIDCHCCSSLSSDARCNTPRRFGIGRIETSGSVAMRGYSHLSDDEREQIGLLKVLGHSIGAIARAIRRPKSTISRELSRNRLPSGRYSPLHAAGAYQLRRRREAAIEKDQALRSFVLDRLAEGWTPEQIAGWLKAGNERRLRAVGCETIYAFIYRAAQKAEQLWRYLTRRHKRRRPRRSRPSRDTIKDRVSIHERPENIDARTEAGHWEGDLIICKRTRPVLVLHERKSRVTLAARLVGKTAAETISVMLAVFARIEPTLRKSITFDNDTAFAQHARLKTMCAMTTWFCDAYASWQKGGVENANGRLRRWLPRQIDIDKVSDEEIQDIILTANLTPRKCLGFKTPFQAILKELGKDVQIQFS